MQNNVSLEKNSKKCKKRPLIIYHDEKNDEFSTAVIEPRKIDGSYKYDRSAGVSAIPRFFWYRMVAIPLAACYLKIKFRHKIIGREKMRDTRGQGRFVYGNHTQPTADALIPTFVNSLHGAYVIVHANNVSMPYLGRVTPYMGALPLPDDMAATRNFTDIIKKRIEQGKSVFIYPEAHIWPYYTKIRPFGEESFMYPIKHGTPVFCFTNTYQKKGRRAHPKMVTYVDGPFYPDTECSPREARKKLREQVYSAMCERAVLSNVEWIEYRRGEDNVNNEESI